MKMKISNLNRLISDLSSREIDLYLYLVKRQDNIGSVSSVYYKRVMEDLSMPKSTFYVAINELHDKGFIQYQNSDSGLGFDIFVLDNEFKSMKDYKKGYVNINLDLILSDEFIALNINIKKFLLRMISLQAGTKQVKILKDTLRRYKVQGLMEELLLLFDIAPDGDGYLFQIKHQELGSKHNSQYLQYENKVINYCRNYNLAYSPIDLRDTIMSIINQVKNNKMALIHKALDSMRRKGSLQPRLINHICGSGPLIISTS